jgi:hypothetical protein
VLFSDAFKIDRTAADDWFDPILDSDTELFVDPFLIFKSSSSHWSRAHNGLVEHFNRIFFLLARTGGNNRSPYLGKALGLLLFPEPWEFGLGYTAQGVRGSGGGEGLARQIAGAMNAAIDRGIQHLDHFETLGIFNEGIGPDRISDLTCSILKNHFIAYTEAVARRHKLATEQHTVEYAGLDETGDWVDATAELPTNPFTEGPILLVPRRFLRRLPTLNATDWWRYYGVKADLNIKVLEGADKRRIVSEAIRHRDVVQDWITQKESEPARPYDLRRDPDLVWRWEPATARFTLAHPVDLIATTKTEFFRVVDVVCAQFKQFIENEAGWELLWNDDGSEKPERAAQNLFRGVAKHYCRANNIAIDREVDLGRGPVDFKFSRGTESAAHLEVKKLDNGRFWHGLYTQLPTYMASDEIHDGWLLGVRLKDSGVTATRVVQLPHEVSEASRESGLNLRYALVDGRPKASASKLRSPRRDRVPHGS